MCVTIYQQKQISSRSLDIWASFNEECTQMVKQLEEQKVFMDMRRKPAVCKHIKSILQQYTKQEIKDWIVQKYGAYQM